MRKASALRLHPKELVHELKQQGLQLLELWASLEKTPSGWVHHSVDRTPERRLKAERLIGDRESSRASVQDWIEAICTKSGGVAASATAIMLVDAIATSTSTMSNQVRQTRAVLLEDGIFVAAVAGQVFVRSSPEDAGFKFIHPDLARLPSAVDALRRLGIQVLDRAGELRNMLSGRRPGQVDWPKAWTLARQCTPAVALSVFREELPDPLESSMRVRTRAGEFVPMGAAYLPGGIVSDRDQADTHFCVDTGFHKLELELLTEIGCVAQPTLRHDPPKERWLLDYPSSSSRTSSPAPAARSPTRTVSCWQERPIRGPSNRSVSCRGSQACSDARSARPDHRGLRDGPTRTNASYGTKKYMNPVHWGVMNHGRLSTRSGRCRRTTAFARPTTLPPTSCRSSSLTRRLRRRSALRGTVGAQSDAWAYLARVVGSWSDARRAFRFYAWAVDFAPAPLRIRLRSDARWRKSQPAMSRWS